MIRTSAGKFQHRLCSLPVNLPVIIVKAKKVQAKKDRLKKFRNNLL
ncbi:hypothetical protein LEP1GSC185_1694 [Leptospira licerasiae serovar Varillal str. VAR 010]|uniref:Uncharacterized protein n=1 Tax=Leptospira licerasiae str. MMD4847 TaxID=1049971 RepID=A0ABN0H5D2_9LEPT|nr:hypothetical protein LEP1GSC185_1694 [Leptospira licerasiae serovar Varillal str. VAR 010]EJZ40626.1 hypothetical protein LEP1GSC178_0957 [Leptospira licerasiae str. MMD4847]